MLSDDMRAAVDSVPEEEADPTTYVTANGTRLKLRRVSQMIVMDASKHIKPPRMPRAFDHDKQRELENPNDPDYQEAMREYQMEIGQLTVNVYLLMGTRVLELSPDLQPLESDEWVEELTVVFPGADVPIGGPRRRLLWMKYHVLSDYDLAQVVQRISTLTGSVREEDVAKAQTSFRSDEVRDTTGRVLDPDEAGRGDRSDSPGGNGSGSGSPGSSDLRALSMVNVDQPVF